jgi:F420-dependent oxidoreductase-like protein
MPSFTYPGGAAAIRPTLADIARAAEEAGFASLWVMDHFLQLDDWGGPDDVMLEAYTTLGYLAGVTTRIRLGALVGGVHFRNPSVLVKAATTLDVLSGGRSYFGIGAGWDDDEARRLGIPFPPRAERYAMLEETLHIAGLMWADGSGRQPFDGRHYRLAEPICNPQPLSRPHPPIMIGGNGEQKTLRLVAQYGDACNFLNLGPDAIRHKLAMLRRHCDEVGRDYDTIERTVLRTVDIRPGRGSVGGTIALLRDLAGAGIQQAIVNMEDIHDPRLLETFGREIIPVVAEFEPVTI